SFGKKTIRLQRDDLLEKIQRMRGKALKRATDVRECGQAFRNFILKTFVGKFARVVIAALQMLHHTPAETFVYRGDGIEGSEGKSRLVRKKHQRQVRRILRKHNTSLSSVTVAVGTHYDSVVIHEIVRQRDREANIRRSMIRPMNSTLVAVPQGDKN